MAMLMCYLVEFSSNLEMLWQDCTFTILGLILGSYEFTPLCLELVDIEIA